MERGAISPIRSTTRGGGAWFENTVVAAVSIGFSGAKSTLFSPVRSASPIRKPAPSETTALNAVDLRGRFEQGLAADRRAEAADPSRIDVGATL